MGATSGDVNSLPTFVEEASFLTSLPVAAMRSGDRAFAADKVFDDNGPLYVLIKDSTLPLGPGVFPTKAAVASSPLGPGRWISENILLGASSLKIHTSYLGGPTLVGPGPFLEILSLPTSLVVEVPTKLEVRLSLVGKQSGAGAPGTLRVRVLIDGVVVGKTACPNHPDLVGTASLAFMTAPIAPGNHTVTVDAAVDKLAPFLIDDSDLGGLSLVVTEIPV